MAFWLLARKFRRSMGSQNWRRSFPSSHHPDLDLDALDKLDPWVIDGRYFADLPDVDHATASHLLAMAEQVVEQMRPLLV